MTVKNTKIQLQFRKAARLMDKNNRLAAENTALKQKLQEQTPLVQAAEKYRDEHRNILNALAKAETGYRNAALDGCRQRVQKALRPLSLIQHSCLKHLEPIPLL